MLRTATACVASAGIGAGVALYILQRLSDGSPAEAISAGSPAAATSAAAAISADGSPAAAIADGSPAAAIADAECYELKGEYYQVIGHAWCHQAKDFKVIYRPLYHCPSAVGRFEAHVLAASHFERWDDKFKRVPLSSLPAAATRLVLPGPFVLDPEWAGAPR